MEERTTDGYIWIGTSVRYLMDAEIDWNVYTDDGVLQNIESLTTLLKQYDFLVTGRVAGPLVAFARTKRAEAVDHKRESPDGYEEWTKSQRMTPTEVSEVRKHAVAVRTTLLAEAEGKFAYIVQEKRFPIDKLLNRVGELMAADSYARLPDEARLDLDEAGKCLAFQRPTAAAFHLMRAVEGVLRHFYCEVVRRNRIAEPRMWAAMTNHLGGLSRPIPKALLDNLDHMRQNFRNPTQHPDKIYDIDEAQDLFALSLDVVNRMIEHLDERA